MERRLDSLEERMYTIGDYIVLIVPYTSDSTKDTTVEWFRCNLTLYKLHIEKRRAHHTMHYDKGCQLSVKTLGAVTTIQHLIESQLDLKGVLEVYDAQALGCFAVFVSHTVMDGRQAAYVINVMQKNGILELKLPPVSMLASHADELALLTTKECRQRLSTLYIPLGGRCALPNSVAAVIKQQFIMDGWGCQGRPLHRNQLIFITKPTTKFWTHRFSQKLFLLCLLLRLAMIRRHRKSLYGYLEHQDTFRLAQWICVDFRHAEVNPQHVGSFFAHYCIVVDIGLRSTLHSALNAIQRRYDEVHSDRLMQLKMQMGVPPPYRQDLILGIEQSNIGKIESADPAIGIFNYVKGKIHDMYMITYSIAGHTSFQLYFNGTKYQGHELHGRLHHLLELLDDCNQDCTLSYLLDDV